MYLNRPRNLAACPVEPLLLVVPIDDRIYDTPPLSIARALFVADANSRLTSLVRPLAPTIIIGRSRALGSSLSASGLARIGSEESLWDAR
jgi:hypothetical protein